MKKIYSVTVKCWDSFMDVEYEKVMYVKASCYTDAVQRAEEYYEDDILSFSRVVAFDWEELCVSPELAKLIEKEKECY